MATARHQLLIVLAAILVFFTNLGGADLFDEDEPKNAACGQEMLARGDWTVPTFNQDLRTDKPILLYWLMLSAYHTFGVNEFAARFWSAALAVGTALVVYHLGRKLYDAQVGFWAAIILATSVNYDVVARASTPDSTFIFFCTLTLLAYTSFGLKRSGASADDWRTLLPASWIGFLPIYAAMGLAVLAKGPAGVVLPGTAIGLFLLIAAARPEAAELDDTWRGRISRVWRHLRAIFAPKNVASVFWAMRPFLALAVVGAIALPWYVAVGVETRGAWLAGFLGKHNVGRFVSSMEGHRGPIFYYVIVIAIGFFPWSVFLLPAYRRWRARLSEAASASTAASDIFAACWAGFYIAFFSLAGTKLPNYVLPSYPALALLTAAMVVDWLREPETIPRIQAALSFGTIAAVGIGLVIALPIVSYFLLPGEWLLALAGVVPLTAGLAMLQLLKRERSRDALYVFGGAAVLQSVVLFGFISGRVATHHTSGPIIAEARRLGGADTKVAVYDYFEPSLVYYARGRVDRFAKEEQVSQYFAKNHERYLITHEKFLPRIQDELPAGVEVLARKRRFLRRGDVVLIGPADALARHAKSATR